MLTPGSRDAVSRAVVALALTSVLGAAALPVRAAAPEQDAAAVRARVERERSEVEIRYTQALRACAGSFALTACQDRARAQRREATERLDAEQAALDDELRRERASQRQRAIAHRRAERASAAAAASAASATERRAAPTLSPSPSPPHAAPAPKADAASAAARREAQSLERYRQRQQQFEAHQAQVRQRNAEQDARHPPAAGLPVPAASASR